MSKEQAELRRWLEEVTDPELSAELLSIRNEEKEVHERFYRSLEFGTVEAEQMVTLRGNRWSDLLREFHHQMHLNFPDTGKNPLLWPVLWSRTAWRFARNNRTIRKTTMRRVIKNARKRGKIAKKLHLFQR